MNVLLLCYRGNPFCGGQGIYIFNLAKELSALGVSVDVIVGPPYPDEMKAFATVHKIENLNIWAVKTGDIGYDKLTRLISPWNFIDFILTRFHIFPEIQTFSIRAFILIKKLVKKKQYHVIHDVNTLGWGLLPVKAFGIPVISTIHHPLTRDMEADLNAAKTFWQKLCILLFYPVKMQKFVINRIDHVITSFKKGSEELNNAFGLDKKKVVVVFNGIDTDLFKNNGEKREKNSILFVGNCEDTKKGIIYLLEAMTMLPEKIMLTIVDSGPPVKTYASDLVKKFRLEDRVTFTGKIPASELVRLYSKKTVLVMPSLFEGFGLPAVEAMACKTPVVVTDAGSLSEVVDRKSGIIVDQKNPSALRDAILKIINNPEFAKSLGESGSARAAKLFSWKSAAKNTMQIYEDIIKKTKGKK